MQNTTPIPVPDGDLQKSADGSRIYVLPGFTTTRPGVQTWNPNDHPPWETQPNWEKPSEAIVEAVHAGDLAKVASLVADASYSPAEYLERALIAAVWDDQLEIGRYLLDHDAKMDKPVMPVIHVMPGSYAATKKSLPFLKLFVEYGWDVNFIDHSGTALFNFIQDYESITWLLAQGADPNLARRETIFVSDGHLLDLVAMWSTVEIFDELIAHGARLEDSLALHHAAAARPHGPLGCNDTRLMARLLELGVDINEPDNKGKQKNGALGAPIFWAIRQNQIANIKFLVENGADLTVKAPFSDRTPLEQARVWDYTAEIAEYLESLSPKDI